MYRRHFTCLLFSLAPAAYAAAAGADAVVRGKIVRGDGPPRLRTTSGQTISLGGDEGTLAVLKDPRVTQYDVEVVGHYDRPGQFTINPIHTRALFAYKGDRRYQVSYWCPVCSIRSYSPGKCWCCQEETNLDLIEPTEP